MNVKEKSIQISIKDQVSEFKKLDMDLVFIERKEFYEKEVSIIETFAGNWFVGFIGDSFSQLRLRSGNSYLDIATPTGILVPPYKLIEWKIGKGLLHWFGFFSKNKLPFPENETVSIFSWNQIIPQNYQEFIQQLSTAKINSQIIESKDGAWISERVKNIIDENYTDDITMDKIAEKLKSNRAYLTRCFTKSYGLSPTDYRIKLRIFEGLKLINQADNKITEAAFASGFSSMNRFEHHFKKIIGVPPSKYVFSKIKT
jgi:AraC-like DNA-binding protein